MENSATIYPPPIVSPTPVLAQKRPIGLYLVVMISVILSGISTGYLFSRRQTKPVTSSPTTMIKTVNEAGTTDLKTFKDYATGALEDGGLNGEGTHKLIRPGGTSQTVYLISSLVDLTPFVGKKVEIYGQTIRAKNVGWLMDVGRIKVLE